MTNGVQPEARARPDKLAMADTEVVHQPLCDHATEQVDMVAMQLAAYRVTVRSGFTMQVLLTLITLRGLHRFHAEVVVAAADDYGNLPEAQLDPVEHIVEAGGIDRRQRQIGASARSVLIGTICPRTGY